MHRILIKSEDDGAAEEQQQTSSFRPSVRPSAKECRVRFLPQKCHTTTEAELRFSNDEKGGRIRRRRRRWSASSSRFCGVELEISSRVRCRCSLSRPPPPPPPPSRRPSECAAATGVQISSTIGLSRMPTAEKLRL